MEHPEMLYLPPNLPGSTPRKPEMVRNPTEGNLPNLEEMGHYELIDLVKKLLVERASKPTSLTNPSKDATVAGHVSMNQESLVQSSQAILQGLAEGGYICDAAQVWGGPRATEHTKECLLPRRPGC